MKRLTFAFGEIVIVRRAFLAEFTAEIHLARALTVVGFALQTVRPVQETIARFAVGEIVVTEAATVAIRWGELFSAFATPGTLFAVPRRVKHVAVTRCNDKIIDL